MIKPLFKWTGGKNRMMKKYDADFWPNREVKIFVDAFYIDLGPIWEPIWAHDMFFVCIYRTRVLSFRGNKFGAHYRYFFELGGA